MCSQLLEWRSMQLIFRIALTLLEFKLNFRTSKSAQRFFFIERLSPGQYWLIFNVSALHCQRTRLLKTIPSKPVPWCLTRSQWSVISPLKTNFLAQVYSNIFCTPLILLYWTLPMILTCPAPGSSSVTALATALNFLWLILSASCF